MDHSESVAKLRTLSESETLGKQNHCESAAMRRILNDSEALGKQKSLGIRENADVECQ